MTIMIKTVITSNMGSALHNEMNCYNNAYTNSETIVNNESRHAKSTDIVHIIPLSLYEAITYNAMRYTVLVVLVDQTLSDISSLGLCINCYSKKI